MKVKLYITALLSILFIVDGYAQGGPSFNNTGGTLRNNGTIRVNFGQVKDLPDSLGGRIEFRAGCYAHTQEVPNIKYTQLVLSGKGVRPIRLDKGQVPLQVYDSLIMRDEVMVSLYEEGIHAKAAVENNIEVGGSKEVRMNGADKAQDILGDGNGKFNVLNIDNPHGVNVVGKFQVDSALILTQGELNNKETNIAIADNATIYRYAEGSLGERPELAANVNVTYTGEGKQIPTGKEIPEDKEKLQDLRVENTGGIIMTEDIQVNRSLYVGARIATEFDEEKKYVLTYTPALNPDFSLSPDAEIDGTFRRTFISYSEKMLMNNRFTWALFNSEEDAPNVHTINFRVKPNRFFELPLGETDKVKRTFEIWAENDLRDTIKEIKKMQVGYAWRNIKDENQDVSIPDVKFLRWNEVDWEMNDTSTEPLLSEDGNWYTANASDIDLLGNFVIGIDKRGFAYLKARVFLEGPYVDSNMRTDLAKLDLLPSTPDNIYPYNKIKDREKVVMGNNIVRDSIVDWVVMEFKSVKGGSTYVPLLLKSNGELLTADGDTAIMLRRYEMDPGDYTVGILHRNHLPVYSLEPLSLRTENNGQEMDFTRTSDVFGKEGSLRPLDVKGGFVLYGMVAGDVNGDNKIDEKDYRLTWENRDQQFLRTIYDINMQGYVNTRDLNYPWNNRDREANIP